MKSNDLTYSEYWKSYRTHGKIEGCFASSLLGCSNRISKAHSLQKNKILSQLEDERQGGAKIYSLEEFILLDGQATVADFKLVGKKSASIFTGFCDRHDVELFSRIENDEISFTNEQLFLFYYRGFAHSYHTLAEQQKFKHFQVGTTIVQNHEDLIYLNDLKWNLKVLTDILKCNMKIRTRLNVMLKNNLYESMSHHYRFVPFTRIATSQVIVAPYTYSNIPLKRHEYISQVLLTIVPDEINQRTAIILSWFNDDNRGGQYVYEIKNLPDPKFKQAISSILMYCGMNTYFSPSLWENFTEVEKKNCLDETNYLIHNGHNHGSFFHSKINFFK